MKQTSAMATNNACNNDVGAAQPQSPLRPQIAFFEFAVFNVLTGQMFHLPFESRISMSQASGVCSLDPLKQSWRCGSATLESHNTSMNCWTLWWMWMLQLAAWIVKSPVTWAGVFVDHAMKVQLLSGNSFRFVAPNCSPRVVSVWNRRAHTNGIPMAYKVK